MSNDCPALDAGQRGVSRPNGDGTPLTRYAEASPKGGSGVALSDYSSGTAM